jgi:phosphonatase-like hydrolase
MARVDLFVFDLAGTTVRDEDHVMRAFVDTASAFDLPADPAWLRPRMGWHKERVFAGLLDAHGQDPGEAAAMARHFEAVFAAGVRARPLRPTPGACEALAALAGHGVRIAFNTGFARVTADVVLAAMGWQHWPSVASDEVVAGRPEPHLIHAAMQRVGVVDPARVGVAGDTPADLLAARAAGAALRIGVGCGTHSLGELAAHPHTHLLADLSALPELVLTEGGVPTDG